LVEASNPPVDESGNETEGERVIVTMFKTKYSTAYPADEFEEMLDDFKYYFVGVPKLGKIGGKYFKDSGYRPKLMTEEGKKAFQDFLDEKKPMLQDGDSPYDETVAESGFSYITGPSDFNEKNYKIDPNGYFMRNMPINAPASSQLYYNKEVGGYCGNVCFKNPSYKN
jgi:hypothetical protein